LGEDAETVFVTGCPSVDLATRVLSSRQNGFNPFLSYGGVGHLFDPAQGYLVVMQHPVTTEYEDALRQVYETLAAIETLGYPTFWFWPNVDAGSDRISKGIRHFRETHDVPFIYFFKNMAPEDFLRLLIGSKCLVGNSSVGIRESSYLGVPIVNIGNRQAGRDRGPNVIDVGYDRKAVVEGVQRHLSNGRYPSSTLYGDGRAGERIADLLSQVPLRIEKRITY
jgi:UDP-hydrolysing UDP-N-acetyl-D-glucosamine 2-epimerase